MVETDTQPYRKKPRGFETARDMLWSLIPLAAVVLALVWFCAPRGQEPVKTVETADDIRGLAEFADYAVVAPDGLAKGWRPTSSRLLRSDDPKSTPVGLTIGYVTPKEQFARFTIEQGERATVLPAAVDGADVPDSAYGKAVEIDGRTWTPFTTSGGRGYLTVEGTGPTGVVIVVAGSASTAELRTLAGSLAPVAAR